MLVPKFSIEMHLLLIAYPFSKGGYMPHFCYRNDLFITRTCRINLIELKNSVKPLVACATESKSVVSDNIFCSDSILLKKAREGVFEFLPLNHPLDRPICDQGGQSDLQNQSKIYGDAIKKFYSFKRIVKDENLGPRIKTSLTRCIYCTRCVRFDDEIIGNKELAMLNRGNKSKIKNSVKPLVLDLIFKHKQIVNLISCRFYFFCNLTEEILPFFLNSRVSYGPFFEGCFANKACTKNFLIKKRKNLLCNFVREKNSLRTYSTAILPVSSGEKKPTASKPMLGLYNTKKQERLGKFKICFCYIKTKLVRDEIQIEFIVMLCCNKEYYYEDMDSFSVDVMKNFEKSLIYFHNFRSLDSYFLLKHFSALNMEKIGDLKIIMRGGVYYELQLSKLKIFFKNSFLLLPVSFNDMISDFNEKHKKKVSFGDENLEKSSLENATDNCKALQWYFNGFHEQIWNLFGVSTKSHSTLYTLSLSIFKNKFYDPDLTPIVKNHYEEDFDIRKAYYNCIQEIKKPSLKDGFCYDVNGLYPAMMSQKKFPIGESKYVKKHEIDLENFIGFISCRVTCEKGLDFLVYKDPERGLTTPWGTWTGTYYAKELRKAVSLGYTIECFYGIRYTKEAAVFDNFVEELNVLKQSSKNTTKAKMFKLILTTLHGRLGMSVNKVLTKTGVGNKGLQNLKLKYDITSKSDIGNDFSVYEVSNKAKSTKQLWGQTVHTDTAVHLSAAITSEARMFMYDFTNIPGNKCCYVNVDCIYLEKELHPSFVHPHEIGKFRFLEKVKEAYFVSPGKYCLKNEHGKINVVMKGIKKSSYDNKKVFAFFKNFVTNGTQKKLKINQEFEMVKIFPEYKAFIFKSHSEHSFKYNQKKRIRKNGIWLKTSNFEVNVEKMDSYGIADTERRSAKSFLSRKRKLLRKKDRTWHKYLKLCTFRFSQKGVFYKIIEIIKRWERIALPKKLEQLQGVAKPRPIKSRPTKSRPIKPGLIKNIESLYNPNKKSLLKRIFLYILKYL